MTHALLARRLILAQIGLVSLLGLAATAATGAERAIDKEVVVEATPDQVWAAWTTREGIVGFFAPDARVEARVGGPFQIHFDPQAEPGLKGADDARFLALQPPRMLSFDWNAPPSLPQARQQRTLVVVRLAPVDERRTRVTLHHVGWGDGGEWDRAYTYFDTAWGRVLANLQRRFEQGPIDWRPWLEQLAAQRQRAAKP
ncbi:SRPBCC domain-containing protein [Ideonella sp. DXS22W]|uniref:SRPBCC domain-containing protein n=1 Tax=Pseudaquabacterium inlustre TaxID=2984192 RepID=A0ABU9CBV7_9BURK